MSNHIAMTKKSVTGKSRAGKPRSYWCDSIEKKLEASGRCGLTKSNILGSKKQPSYNLRESVVGELLDQRKIVFVGAKDWKGKSQSVRFIHRTVLLRLLDEQSQSTALDPVQLRKSYEHLVTTSGFPDVRIIDLASAGGFPIIDLVQAIRSLHMQGKAELSRGDWSLASQEEKNASIEWQGQHYLRVQLK